MITFIQATFTFFLGNMTSLLKVLCIFIGAELIINLLCKIVNKKMLQTSWKKWICNKIIIFILIGLTNIVEIYIIGSNGTLRAYVIISYIATEGILILHTVKTEFKLPIPKCLEHSFKDICNKSIKGIK